MKMFVRAPLNPLLWKVISTLEMLDIKLEKDTRLEYPILEVYLA